MRQDVIFKVTALLDPVKTGKLKLDGTYTGGYSKKGNNIFYKDGDIEWFFYPGITCEIVSRQPKELIAPDNPTQSKLNLLRANLKQIQNSDLFTGAEKYELCQPIVKQMADAEIKLAAEQKDKIEKLTVAEYANS